MKRLMLCLTILAGMTVLATAAPNTFRADDTKRFVVENAKIQKPSPDGKYYEIQFTGVNGEKVVCPLNGTFEVKVTMDLDTLNTRVSYSLHGKLFTIYVRSVTGKIFWENAIKSHSPEDVVPEIDEK